MRGRIVGAALSTTCRTVAAALSRNCPIVAAAFVLLSLLMAGCGAGEPVTILKAALSQNPSEPQVRAVELFADLVGEGTEGRIRVQVYPNNQLGSQRDVLEGLQMGSIELANIASVMAGFVPETNLFELPFLFDGPEHFPAPYWARVGWIRLMEYVVMSRSFYNSAGWGPRAGRWGLRTGGRQGQEGALGWRQGRVSLE